MLWLGVDVGGTFTDLVLFDADSGALTLGKTPSPPRDQSEGILAGIAQLAAEPSALERIVHGTTVATNTALERDGARLAVLVSGHRRSPPCRRPPNPLPNPPADAALPRFTLPDALRYKPVTATRLTVR